MGEMREMNGWKPKWMKIGSIVLAAVLALALAACGKDGEASNGGASPAPTAEGTGAPEQQDADKLTVVTSFYPLYFFASEIGGDRVEAVNLIAAGVEPHDWTPKSRDLTTASNAELFLYHGAGLETWVDDFLKGLPEDRKHIAKEMSGGIELIDGEDAAGTEGHDDGHSHKDDHAHEDEHGHEDEHAHEDEHGHGEEGHSHSHEIDPHTWVSPKSALVLAENVKNSLIEADPDHTANYEANFEVLKGKLQELDRSYTEQLAGVTQRNMVVSHQAFGYLARDYGLNQLSIMGLSADAEPRAQDIIEIAKFVKENGVRYIFFEELVSDEIANMLASEANVETLVLNPLEGLTEEQERTGDNYLTLMERNLQNLIQALQ